MLVSVEYIDFHSIIHFSMIPSMNMVNNHFYYSKSQSGFQDIPDVFCFQVFLSGFLFRVRGEVRVRDGLGDDFRVRVGVRASGGLGFIYNCQNMVETKLCPSGIFEN